MVLIKCHTCRSSQSSMNVPQLLAECDEVIGGNFRRRVLNGFNKWESRKTSPFDIAQVERGCGSAEVRNADLERLGQDTMAFKRGSLLKFIESDVNLLEPFLYFLNEQFNQLFLERIFGFNGHRLLPFT